MVIRALLPVIHLFRAPHIDLPGNCFSGILPSRTCWIECPIVSWFWLGVTLPCYWWASPWLLTRQTRLIYNSTYGFLFVYLYNWHYAEATINTPLDKWLICLTKYFFVSNDMRLCLSKDTLILSLVNGLWIFRMDRSATVNHDHL